MSLPTGERNAVPLDEVLSSDSYASLQLPNIVADDDVIEWRESTEPIRCYCDVRLRGCAQEYRQFLHRLYQSKLLGFARFRKSEVQPFLLKRKGTGSVWF